MKAQTPNDNIPDSFTPASPAMIEKYEEVADYARHHQPCVFFGPSGVGKEFLAQYYYKSIKKAGKLTKIVRFVSFNCAGFSKELAISELFGHVKGAFTGAISDKDGLFKFDKNELGVVFLDEIGDLDEDVQPMLLRAIDTNKPSARQLGSDKDYLTENVIVISATDQPKEKIRKSLLARLGVQIDIPGIEHRKDDIPLALRFFIRNALKNKRRDSEILINRLFQGNQISYEKALDNLTDAISQRILADALQRKWIGNFRSLRIAVDIGIMRAKNTKSVEGFIDDVVFYYFKHQDNYSTPLTFARELVSKPYCLSSFRFNNSESDISDNLKAKLIGIKESYKVIIVGFLIKKAENPFKRAELQALLPLVQTRTLQSWLKILEKQDIIKRSGSKGDLYTLNQSALKSINSSANVENTETEAETETMKADKISSLMDCVANSQYIFVGGKSRSGKTTTILALEKQLSNKRKVIYFSFKDRNFDNLVENIFNESNKASAYKPESVILSDNEEFPIFLASLKGLLELVYPKKSMPLIILDDLQCIRESHYFKAIRTMISYWQNFSFIIVGIKLESNLEFIKEKAFTEFILD